MTPAQTRLLLLAGALGLAGFLVGWPRLNATQRSLAVDLVNIGLVGTAVGVPLGLWAVPTFRERPWLTAGILTAASFGTKALLLPHESHETGPARTAERELAAVY